MESNISQSYSTMNTVFNETGITYKSNETLHRLSEERQYPYLLLLHATKTYHFNQFEVVFFSHILYEEEPSYQIEPQIFEHELKHPIIQIVFKKQQVLNVKDIRNMYTYLMVVGYSVKYYLNESIKAYQEEVRRQHHDFFTSIFNSWANKYGNKVLKTNPRRINTFYINIFQTDDLHENAEVDCQYRNYNEIVEELIKATTQNDVHEKVEDIDHIAQV